MKAWFKSKTLWVAFGIGFLGLIQTTMETAPIPEAYAGLVTIGIGFVVGVLRAVTTKAVGAADG